MILQQGRLAGALMAVLSALAACSQKTERPPNIVLIISDDQAWTDYSFMGHEAIRTPHLDKLAAESMVYTRGYVPTALCRPSLATIMTGLYPHQHGITGNDPDGAARDAENRARMVDVFTKSETVAALLQQRGYLSHQSGKWWEGQCRCGGFTHCMTHGDVERGGRHGDEGLKIGRETMQPIYDFIAEAGEKPFFLWYAPFLPHTPHNPPERLLAAYRAPGRSEAVAKYYAMCEWFDETVGALLGRLDAQGLRENTVVLYLQDNGWIQTDRERQAWYESRAKISPYDAGVRTPIMVRWPGKIAPGRDERTLVSSIDPAPTILSIAGIEPPPHMPGIDLRDTARLARRKQVFGALFAHTAVDVNVPLRNLKYRSVVRADGWKLIVPYAPNEDVALTIRGRFPDWMRSEPELYNVIDDPLEAEDRAADRPEIARRLRAALDRWWPVP